jgi:hypothetical protein
MIMSYLTSGNAHNAVLADTVKYKEIPTFTFRTSTYKNVFNGLTQFDLANNTPPKNELLITTALISLRAQIEDWLVKPDHQQAFSNANSASSSIKKVFDTLLTEVDTTLENSWQAQDVKEIVGKDVAEKLTQQLIKNEGYSASSNPLLVLVLNKLISTYQLNAISKDNFRQELLKLVISSNDLRGASSFLIQALGGKGAFTFSIDFGKLILPFLTLSLDLGASKITNSSEVIYFDCLATDFSENEEDHRYGFYTMYGWSREYQAEVGITAGVKISTASGDDPLIELEIAGINALPSFDPPSASGSVSAGVKVKTCWTILNVTDLSPAFFTSINSDDIAEKVLKSISDPLPQKVTFNNEIGVVLNMYSNAYGGDAFASAQASAEVPAAGISVSASGNVKADIRKSTMVLQAPSSSRPKMKKTQVTDLWLKQVGANAKLVASGKLLGTTKDVAEKGTEYSFVNSYSYASTVVYWNAQDQAKSVNALARSGYSKGQSLNATNLLKYIDDIKANINYFLAIANQLNIRVEQVSAFFESNKTAITDIIDTITYYVNKDQLPQSILSSIVVESSFALKKDKNLKFSLNESTSFPENEFREQLKKDTNLYLESIRFRIPSMSQSYEEKPGFKLGVNLGIVKFGIDLGMIEQASTISMDDLIISWFDSGGSSISDRPVDYVPSTAIIL